MSLTKKEHFELGIYNQETTERYSPLHPGSTAVREMIITAFLEGIHQNYNEKLETSTVVEGPRADKSVERAEVLTQISGPFSPPG